MYYFYFGKVLFPIAPEKIETKIKGNNQTITLINEGEINQIKSSKLTEFSFDLLLPQINKYPFAVYNNSEFTSAEYYLEQIETFKNSTTGFNFKVVRTTPAGKVLFDTTMLVTIEEYTIKEEAQNGFDIVVSVTLKKYVKYGTVKVKVKKSGSTKTISKKTRRKLNRKLPATYTVNKGDTLYNIAKKYYTVGTKAYRQLIYNKNEKVIENAAKKAGYETSVSGKYLVQGTKLTIPKVPAVLMAFDEV